jgi:POT family proton-dependent oligopeptide transporter
MNIKPTSPLLESESSQPRHPQGLYVLFATELWERFGFYSMVAMLTLYLQHPTLGFSWTTATATSIYSTYLGFVFFSPLIGGFLADRWVGYRLSISIGGLALAAGYFMLCFPSAPMLYLALVLLVIGNGFFKPNVSTLVGNLYPDGSPLKDSAYNIFYMGINLGAFVAPIAAEALWQQFGFRRAFAASGAGMLLSLFIFLSLKKYVFGQDKGKDDTLRKIQSAPPRQASDGRRLIDAVPDSKRIMALIVIFLLVIIFWMVFFQNGSTLTYWANNNTDWESSRVVFYLLSILTFGTVKPSGVISNAINPFWIITLTFPLVWFWRWLGKKGKEPSTPVKMTIGMFMTAGAFYLIALAAFLGGDHGKVSPWWLIVTYAMISLGELMLSPMGLSLVSKVAPARMRGVMMGGWFVATAIGSKLTVIGVYWDVWNHSTFFLILASLSLLMGIVLILLLRPLKKAMPGI